MSSQQKERLDHILELRSSAWASFDARRQYEWKLGIGLWTALATLIGILLTRNITISHGIRYGSLGFALAILALHSYFRLGLERANNVDKAIFRFYDQILRRSILLDGEYDEVEKLIAKARMHRKGVIGIVSRYWSVVFQLLVTLLLSAAVCAIVLLKS